MIVRIRFDSFGGVFDRVAAFSVGIIIFEMR